eukprot:CAMPEP_0171120632 /NCGR_PEP_ID=MMETSP0766_2-20121228/100179_1 /TAXON_ID=439317 /ORGANISM="Gambierdiscus australes, Strain CAWD 149" /LENGTH=97 /DNA_ID=CAMNT_0011583375 /DNA_START=81 /DNA_END=370 /DNA_ORIENTATION=+
MPATHCQKHWCHGNVASNHVKRIGNNAPSGNALRIDSVWRSRGATTRRGARDVVRRDAQLSRASAQLQCELPLASTLAGADGGIAHAGVRCDAQVSG